MLRGSIIIFTGIFSVCFIILLFFSNILSSGYFDAFFLPLSMIDITEVLGGYCNVFIAHTSRKFKYFTSGM